MKNTKVSKVMLSTIVTGGIVLGAMLIEARTSDLAKGETQIELPSSELESYKEVNAFDLPDFEGFKKEGERLQAEREEKLRLEQERIAREKAEAERKAREEAERIERERLARIEAERKAQAEAEAKKLAQQQAQSEQAQDTQGMAFNGSYYTATCSEGCTGVTATGVNVVNSIYHQGMRVIAVDPNVIPLYSIVEVSTPHETFKAIALDTGGAIKGRKVDILVANERTASSLGRHTVYIKILRSGK